jgi:hypothetical protein
VGRKILTDKGGALIGLLDERAVDLNRLRVSNEPQVALKSAQDAGQQVTVCFYCEYFLPRVSMHLHTTKAGSAVIMALDEDQF